MKPNYSVILLKFQKNKLVIYTGLMLAMLSACTNSRKGNVAKECIALNDKGVSYLVNPTFGEKGTLDKAINLFKEAIECDSNYLIAYINIANAYGQKHDFPEVMKAYNFILKHSNNSPVFVVQKAILFERINQTDSAKNYYNIAMNLYSKQLLKNPNNVGVIKEVISLKAYMGGKDDAIKEIDKQIMLHPNLERELSIDYELYKYFNRYDAIHGLTTEVDMNKR